MRIPIIITFIKPFVCKSYVIDIIYPIQVIKVQLSKRGKYMNWIYRVLLIVFDPNQTCQTLLNVHSAI